MSVGSGSGGWSEAVRVGSAPRQAKTRRERLFPADGRSGRKRPVGRRAGPRRELRSDGAIEVVTETRQRGRVVGVDESLCGSGHCEGWCSDDVTSPWTVFIAGDL